MSGVSCVPCRAHITLTPLFCGTWTQYTIDHGCRLSHFVICKALGSDSDLCRRSTLIPRTRARKSRFISKHRGLNEQIAASSGHRVPRNGHATKVAALYHAFLEKYARFITKHARIPFAHRAHGRWKLAILPPPQLVHGESTNSPLRSANAAAAGALGDGKEHASRASEAAQRRLA